MSFAAQFPGKCALCGEWFSEGTQIERDPDGRGYRHTDCDNDDPQPSIAREVCDRCWLEKSLSGECGCEA